MSACALIVLAALMHSGLLHKRTQESVDEQMPKRIAAGASPAAVRSGNWFCFFAYDTVSHQLANRVTQ